MRMALLTTNPSDAFPATDFFVPSTVQVVRPEPRVARRHNHRVRSPRANPMTVQQLPPAQLSANGGEGNTAGNVASALNFGAESGAVGSGHTAMYFMQMSSDMQVI